MRVRASVRTMFAAAVAVLLLGALATPAAAQDTGTVAGQVVEVSSQRPLAGAQVYVPGTELGTLTNSSGRYVVTNVPGGEAVVRVTMVGYATAEQTVTVTAGASATANFELETTALALDEIVVTGTAGQARRREIGNTIAQINMQQVVEPVARIDNLLQGRVPGITVNPGHASPGAGARIRLRGNVSVTQSNQPLIYIDGVRQTTAAYPRNRSEGQASHQGENFQSSPLNDISPADIERIEILKGPAASTLYGTEASAGVIQIFTKHGRTGAPTWTIESNHNLSWIQPFGSKQNPYFGIDPWLKTAYGYRNHLSVGGGTETIQYYVSGMFADRDGFQPPDEESRKSVRTNLTFSPRESVVLESNFMFSTHDFRSAGVGNSLESLLFSAIYPHVPAGDNISGGITPETAVKLFEVDNRTANKRINLGFTASWSPWSNFRNRFTVGYDRGTNHQTQYRPYGFITEPEGNIVDLRFESSTLTLDYVATYDRRWTESLRSSLSVGGQLTKTSESKLDGFGRGLPGPGRQHTLSAAANRLVFMEAMNINTGGFFLQNLFDFKDRYFLTLGLRVDGNSAFGEAFGLQPYPKASLSYIISDEDFWPDSWGQVKLRGAYGHAGRAPGAFDAVRTWQPGSFRGQPAVETRNPGNPELGPERTAEIEVGFDGSFLDNRLRLDFTYYNQTTMDALFPVARPPSTGFLSSQIENVGELTNEGIEAVVDATLIRSPRLEWTLGGSISANRSRIVEIGSATSYELVVGQPAPVLRGTKVLNADELADPILEEDAFFGPWLPTHIFGINTRLQLPWGVTVFANGEYQGGHWTTVRPMYVTALRPGGARACDHVYQIVPWDEYTGPGDTYPNLDQVRALDRARCYRQATQPMWVVPADFFKIRSVTAELPVPFALPRVNDASISVSLRNFWRWTNEEFRVFDPEMAGGRSHIEELTTGINEILPAPAIFTLSLRARF